MERAGALLGWLVTLSDWLLYLIVGVASVLENFIPPLPADTVIVIGGVIAGIGGADPGVVFLVVWLSNAAGAMAIYGLGRRYGTSFFSGRIGRFLLAPHQLQALAVAYQRYGFPIIFFSRFLPVFRPVVPVFAGTARIGFLKTTTPIVLASAIWYGLLVYLGTIAGANWRSVIDLVTRMGWGFWAVAIPLLLGLVWLWHRSRAAVQSEPRSDGGER